MRITRLGAGVDAARRLQPAAIARTLEVLAEYRSIMDAARVTRARLVATSAVRDAANAEAFLEPAAEVIGVPAELLSGVEEGRLSYAGAAAELPPVAGRTVVVDIGGGSTEIVTMVDGRDHRRLARPRLRAPDRAVPARRPAVAPTRWRTRWARSTAKLGRAVRDVPVARRARPAGPPGRTRRHGLDAGRFGAGPHRLRPRAHPSLGAVARCGQEMVRGARGASRPGRGAERAAIPEGRVDVIFGGALVLARCMARFGVRRVHRFGVRHPRWPGAIAQARPRCRMKAPG